MSLYPNSRIHGARWEVAEPIVVRFEIDLGRYTGSDPIFPATRLYWSAVHYLL